MLVLTMMVIVRANPDVLQLLIYVVIVLITFTYIISFKLRNNPVR